MKHYLKLIIAAVFFLTSFVVSAQRIEVFGGYSVGSEIGKTPAIHAPFDVKVNTPMELGSHQRQNNALTLGLNVRILGNLSIGVSWTGLTEFKQLMHYKNSDQESEISQRSNTVLFNVKYEWLKLWKIHFYSRGGVGAVFFSSPKYDQWFKEWMHNYEWRDGEPESCKRFAWQLSYLGIELRPIRNVGIFVEGGVGRQGALLTGIKVFI